MAHADYRKAHDFLCSLDSEVVESDEEVIGLWKDRKLPLAFTNDYDACWAHLPDETGVFVDKAGVLFRIEAQSHLASQYLLTYQLASTFRSIQTTYSAVIVAKITWSAFLKSLTANEQRHPPQVLRQRYIDRFLSKVPKVWREVILIGNLHLGDNSTSQRTNNGIELPNIYKALAEPRNIRLVSISSALQTHEPIRCSLYEVRLDSLPDFEALSYMWGDPTARRDIFLNGVRFSVTENLYFALEGLRYRTSDRTIWIDAICINQSDIDERQNQVAQMDAIYSQATEVVVWLGRETITSSMAFAIFNDISKHELKRSESLMVIRPPTWELLAEKYSFKPVQFMMNGHKLPMKEPGLPDQNECSDLEDIPQLEHAFQSRAFQPTAIEAYLKLLQRPYWDRMWVLQEVILAKKVSIQCGRQSAPWQLFLRVILNFRQLSDQSVLDNIVIGQRVKINVDLGYRIKKIFPFMFLHRDLLLAEKPAPESLACFLSITVGSQATDARDKIYGLLGLLQTESTARIQFIPSYSQSAKRLFIAVTRYFLDATKKLDVLTAKPSTSQRPSTGSVTDLPSWAPDWTDASDRFSNVISLGIFSNFFTRNFFRKTESGDLALSHASLYQAGLDADSDNPHSFSHFDEVFNVCGFEVGKIVSVLSLPHDPTDYLFNDYKPPRKPGDATKSIRAYTEQKHSVFYQCWDVRLDACRRICGEVYEHTGQTLEEAFWRTVFLDRFYDTFAKPRKLGRIPVSGGPFIASKLFNHPGGVLYDGNGLLDCPFPPQTKEDRKRIQSYLHVQCAEGITSIDTDIHGIKLPFIITENGWIGAGHPNAVVGDTVAVLRGGSVPYVLREYSEGHILVGECYIHGIMDGELVKQQKQDSDNEAGKAAFTKFRIL